jgi:hypothetical protein
MDAKAMAQIALAHAIAQIAPLHRHEVVESTVKQIPHAWPPAPSSTIEDV